MLQRFYKIIIIPYALFLLYLMFFGFSRTPMNENVVRIKPVISTVDIAKFCIEREAFWFLTTNIGGNIILFVPFGFLGWFSPKFLNFKTLIIFFLSVITIVEALQYFTRLGVFDIDDIILNAIGVAIGFYIRKIIDSRFIRKQEQSK